MSEQERHTSFALWMVLTLSLGGFLFGYTTGVISGALIFISQAFSLTTFQESLAVSMILIGAIVGSLAGGELADRFGRKKITILTSIFFFIGIWICVVTSSFNLLLTGRFITGIALGINSATTPIYLAEIAPKQRRGAFVSSFQLALALGILVAYLVNYFFSEAGAWRSMFAVGLIPTTLLFLGMLLFPESPSWLWAKGRYAKAQKVMKKLRQDREWEKALKEESEDDFTKKSGYADLIKPSIRNALIVGIGISIFQQFTGINTVIYYASKIFQGVGFASASSAIFASVGLGIVNVLATVISVWLLDKVGRRPLLLIGVAGMVISLLTLSLGFYIKLQAIDLIASISLMAYVAFFSFSLGPISWVLISEIYPLHVRARAMSLALAANWLCNYIVSLTFLNLVSFLTIGGAFCFYAAIGILAFIFICRRIPETKGKSFEEIERILKRT